MNHKLQVPSFTNDGSKTVGRTDSTSDIASNDAGFEPRPVADSLPDNASGRESRLSEIAALETAAHVSDCGQNVQEHTTEQRISTGLATPPPEQSQERTQSAQTLPSSLLPLRCEVARSHGYDPTGERAVPCGAVAQVICEYCGPMCPLCAEETFCFQGEHRLVEVASLAESVSGNSEAADEPVKPLFEVVYLELQCPYCDTVRLALPRANAPDAHWTLACPICSAPATWTYLAHGLTQRELPFYECFDPESLSKDRIPWDQLLRLVEEENE